MELNDWYVTRIALFFLLVTVYVRQYKGELHLFASTPLQTLLG